MTKREMITEMIEGGWWDIPHKYTKYSYKTALKKAVDEIANNVTEYSIRDTYRYFKAEKEREEE